MTNSDCVDNGRTRGTSVVWEEMGRGGEAAGAATGLPAEADEAAPCDQVESAAHAHGALGAGGTPDD